MEQISFGEEARIEATNEPHLACVLLLDSSGSMTGCIDNLNKAVSDFKTQVCKNEDSRNRVDVAVVEFNTEVRVVQDFVPISDLPPINLQAGGYTAMGTGIQKAIDLVKERNRFYNNLGTPCFKPWIFMITDGMPEGEPAVEIENARIRIMEEEAKGQHGKLKFFAVAVDNANRDILASLTSRVIELREANFDGIFNWLSDSMTVISVSSPDNENKLNPLPSDARKYDPDRDVSDW